jgi:hypothetical protein
MAVRMCIALLGEYTSVRGIQAGMETHTHPSLECLHT